MNMRQIKSYFPWSKAAMQAGDGNAEADTGTVALITSAEPQPSPTQASVGFLADIAKKVSPGQERLAMELAAGGKSRADIFEALYDDLKASIAKTEAQPPKPAVTTQDVAAEVLKELRAGTPAAPSTSEGQEPNVYEQYKAISNPESRRAFYDSHKDDIDRISKAQSTKEGN
ncbi:hypothetical protein R83H12_00426 [Fibrobacteria bacterium R8-3-H12]